jgi:opacity protein-like surface antigen
MKTYLQFGLAGFIATSSAAWADVPPDGWYAGLLGEVSHSPSMDFTLTPSELAFINYQLTSVIAPSLPLITSAAGQIKYNVGWGGGVQVGYRYCGFRFEGEFLYNQSDYNRLTLGGLSLSDNPDVSSLTPPYSYLSLDGNTSFGAGLFNVYYDFYDFEEDVSWIPYIGVGIGYGSVRNKLRLDAVSVIPLLLGPASPLSTSTTTVPLINVREKTSTPVGQLIAGIAYQFTENFSAGLDYRYITTKKLNYLDERYSINSANLTLNYWWPNQ